MNQVEQDAESIDPSSFQPRGQKIKIETDQGFVDIVIIDQGEPEIEPRSWFGTLAEISVVSAIVAKAAALIWWLFS